MWHIVIEVIASMNSVLYLHDSDRMACHARVHQDSSLDNVVVDTLVPPLALCVYRLGISTSRFRQLQTACHNLQTTQNYVTQVFCGFVWHAVWSLYLWFGIQDGIGAGNLSAAEVYRSLPCTLPVNLFPWKCSQDPLPIALGVLDRSKMPPGRSFSIVLEQSVVHGTQMYVKMLVRLLYLSCCRLIEFSP